MTFSEKVIRNCLSRATWRYLEKGLDQVKEEDGPNTRLHCNKHGRFSCLMNDENSLILKKNRDLDEAGIDAVKDGIDVLQRREISVFSPFHVQNGAQLRKEDHT